MARLDQIQIIGGFNSQAQSNSNLAYAGNFSPYEIQTPQYPYPNPYQLAVHGYRRNELIYACVNRRAKAIAEAPIQVKDITDEKNLQTLPQHKLRQLLSTPIRIVENGEVVFTLTEKSFWRATATYLAVAGFAAWEMEFNNLGEPINLFPMRPDWCSFRRGDRNPLKFIRYQPWGLPYADIPLSRVLLFQYFDPIFPLLKALSPTAVANRSLSVDNATTDFLQIFFQRGAVINGLLKTDQSLDDASALRYRQLWSQQHGGIQNWGEANTAVLGSGLSYQSIQMNMRDMAFPEVDARAETHICEAFEMPAILVGAKVGTENAHLNVYREARAAWYDGWVTNEWDWLDSEIESQLLSKFESEPERFSVSFDTTKVRALSEDQSTVFERADKAAKSGLMYRDEIRSKILGEDVVDDGEKVWLNVTVRAMDTGGIDAGGLEGIDTTGGKPSGGESDAAFSAGKALETKQYKAWLKRGAKSGKTFTAKYLSDEDMDALKNIKSLDVRIEDALAEFQAAMKQDA